MTAVPTEPPTSNAKELQQLKSDVDLLKLRAAGTATLAPNIDGAPKGAIILGDKAGSLAPWLAHQVLADVADDIAATVAESVQVGRILVTDDATLLRGDLISHQVHVLLRQRTDGLSSLRKKVNKVVTDLEAAVKSYVDVENPVTSAHEGTDDGTDVATHTLPTGQRSGEFTLLAPGERPPALDVTGAAEDEDEKKDQDETPAEEEAAAPSSAVSVALDLVRMTAVDYTVTAAAVTAETGLLPRLTAGSLATTSDPVAAQAARNAFEDAAVAARAALKARQEAENAADAADTAATQAGENAHATAQSKKQAQAAARAARAAADEAQEAAAERQRQADKAWADVGAVSASIVPQRAVLLDGFAGVDPKGPTLKTFTKLHDRMNALAAGLLDLRKEMAPVEAELTKRRAELTETRTKWNEALAEKEPNAGKIAALKTQVDDLARQIDRRTIAIAPAQTFLDHANARITAAESALATLTIPDSPSGTSPLLRACSREGLHADQPAIAGQPVAITHVLYVGSTHLGADIVTRHSILGSSGRLGFLGGTNAAWILLESESGTVVDGGAAKRAQAMTYDLASGKYAQGPPEAVDAAELAADPLAQLEDQMRWVILLAAFALLVLSLVGVLALFV